MDITLAEAENLFAACAAVFALYPPLILGYRLFRQKPPWWITIPSILVLGWASWLGAVVFHFEYLGALIDSQENPPDELMDEWASDGGPKVGALFFGWAIAAAYASLWWAVFVLVKAIQGLVHIVKIGRSGSRVEVASLGGSALILIGALCAVVALLAIPAGAYGFAGLHGLVGGSFLALGTKLRRRAPYAAG